MKGVLITGLTTFLRFVMKHEKPPDSFPSSPSPRIQGAGRFIVQSHNSTVVLSLSMRKMSPGGGRELLVSSD